MHEQINPYIAGPPVKGDDFYERDHELRQVLEATHKEILFVSTRRMGKTSLLKQLAHLSESKVDYGLNLCLYWNLQGKRDEAGALMRLKSPRTKKRLHRVDWERVEDLDTCCEVLEVICGYYECTEEPRTIVLMIDEPDILRTISYDGDTDFVSDLKDAFDNIPNLRVVLVSPPRIRELHPRTDIIASMLENFQSYHLNPFSKVQVQRLVELANRDQEIRINFLQRAHGSKSDLIDEIMEASNGCPFYVQLICKRIFDNYPARTPSESILSLIEDQTLSAYFYSDFQELNVFEELMLLRLVNAPEPLDADTLVEDVRGFLPALEGETATRTMIDNLVALGVLRRFDADRFHISNMLFDQWLRRDFDNHWNRTMKAAHTDSPYAGRKLNTELIKRKDLQSIQAQVASLDQALAINKHMFDDGKITPEEHHRQFKSDVRERASALMRLHEHLRALGADPVAALILEVVQSAKDEQLVAMLDRIGDLGDGTAWSDIPDLTRQHYPNDAARAAVNLAFRVADRLTEG